MTSLMVSLGPKGKLTNFKVQMSPNVRKNRFYQFIYAIVNGFKVKGFQKKFAKFFYGHLF